MDVGLSKEMVEMIEERLGRPWANAALWGVTVLLIVSPAIAVGAIILVLVGVVAGVWGWALEQVSDTTTKIMIGVVIGVALVYLSFNMITRWMIRRQIRIQLDSVSKDLQDDAEHARELIDQAAKSADAVDAMLAVLEEKEVEFGRHLKEHGIHTHDPSTGES